MTICPACNGFKPLYLECPTCHTAINDLGRIMDYYDDYSAYMPIDQMKLEDGLKNDLKNNECPHLVTCPQCGYQNIYLVKE